jgi:hypothetical protein
LAALAMRVSMFSNLVPGQILMAEMLPSTDAYRGGKLFS